MDINMKGKTDRLTDIGEFELLCEDPSKSEKII